MGLKVPLESISWLKGYSDKHPEEAKKLEVYELDYAGDVSVTVVGKDAVDKEEELTDWFYAWYNPAGYGSSVRKVSKDGSPALLFHRFKSCD